MPGIPLPTLIRKTKKCDRCGMRFKVIFGDCPHCNDIPDGELLEQHKRNHQKRLQANVQLGTIFLAVTVLLAACLIILTLG